MKAIKTNKLTSIVKDIKQLNLLLMQIENVLEKDNLVSAQRQTVWLCPESFIIEPSPVPELVKIWFEDGQIILPEKTLADAYERYQARVKDPKKANRDWEYRIISKHVTK